MGVVTKVHYLKPAHMHSFEKRKNKKEITIKVRA